MQHTEWLFLALCALVTSGFPGAHGLGIVLLPGDVYLEFIGSVYMDTSCRVVDVVVMQDINAIKWTLDRLNKNNFINGVRLGLRVNPTCQSVERATQVTHQLIVEMGTNTTIDVVGVLGSDYSSESEAISRMLSSLPDQHRLLQVSYAATSASLRNRELYRNFFRTIPADDIQVQVMHEFLVQARWTMLMVIYINDTYGRGGFKSLSDSLIGSDICLAESVAIEPEKYNVTWLEEVVKTKIYKIGTPKNDPPVSGIVVFGNYPLVETLFHAVQNLENDNETSNYSRPSFILSEAGAYFEGQFPNVSKGAFVLSPPRRIISEFQTYWKESLTLSDKLRSEVNVNGYFKAMYETVMNCQFANEVLGNYCRPMTTADLNKHAPPSVYTQYAIQSVLVTAFSVKHVHASACPGGGACDVFQNATITKRSDFIDAIQNKNIVFDQDFNDFRLPEFRNPLLSVRFKGTSDVGFVSSILASLPEYEVYNHRLHPQCPQPDIPCLIKIASYNEHTSLNQSLFSAILDYDDANTPLVWPNIRKPQCPDGYRSDFCLRQRSDTSVLYHKGDMYVVGAAPVHNTGISPLECGNITKGGLDIVEAIRYGIMSGSGAFENAKIGLIVIDSCNDPQIIQEKILTLHRLGVYVNGKYEPVADRILGYVGGWSSDVSTAIAKITSRLGLVQISYASTAPSLSNRYAYPYFLRIPSADDDQAATLLKIVKALGGSTIQVIYSQTIYGEGGRNLIQKLADQPDYSICIGNEIPVSKDTQPATIVDSLRASKEAQIVVAFIASFELENIIGYLNQELALNEFLFVASEEWGLRLDMSRYPKLRGTITVASRLWTTDGFESHLKTLQPDTKEDPWIRPYLESLYDCYFESSFDKSSKMKCNGTATLDEGNGVFRIESWAPFAERAVSVLLKGVASTLKKLCGSTQSVCLKFRNSTGELLAEVKAQEALIEPQDIVKRRVFNENGDGTIGYRIYASDASGKAIKLGTSDSLGFQFPVEPYYNHRPRGTINTNCTAGAVCRKCSPQPTPSPGGMKTQVPGGAVAAIVVLAVFVCVLVVALVCICRRTGCCLRCDALNPRFDNTYLTAIYEEQRRQHGVDGSKTSERKTEDYDFLKDSQDAGLSYGGLPGQNNQSDQQCTQTGRNTQSLNSQLPRDRLFGSVPEGDSNPSVAVSPGNDYLTSPQTSSGGTSRSRSGDSEIRMPSAHSFDTLQKSNTQETLSTSDVSAPQHSYITAQNQQDRTGDEVDTFF